jgi:transcriptional regulator with XRE-family HTH domain
MNHLNDRDQLELLVAGITARRKQHGVSQEFIKETHHLDVSRIETGQSIPNLGTYLRLCNILSICPGWLLVFCSLVKEKKLSKSKQTVWYILIGFLLRVTLPGKNILCNYLITEPRFLTN